ncbi:hypothetical protein MIMGU_mgv1a019503mg [Erythranthe guttata]|uniref:C2H2-type domain-containing protein n=1 Tax=Erythranthe guttata TaxID=4155 RepID=A0A022PYP2_ERYGU|nr:PREDICTED: zinc finger protein ZAT6-like [Erythranthe guttata]EYU19360.1 hypothetical protein MIMGU_mgv1a019503mg [Erythranthe guttata]|eukprot:XP_012859026.1 PREDICTED: zinc finger protein ZAT6-like [Erythranthe guttata]
MALDRSLNSAPPLKNARHFDFLDLPSSSAVVGSWKKSSRRSKRRWQIKLGEDELSAARLVMLARTGGGPYPSPPAAAAASPSTEESKHDGDNPVCPVPIISAAASLHVKISQESVPTTPSPPPAVPKSYRRCADSGKGFNSYQALGGHKASCCLKPTTAAAIDRNPYAVIPAVATASTRCTSGMNRSGKIHECETCQKTFTSGQALGGHKRMHYEGVIGARSKKSRKTSSNGGAATQKMIRDFDLNLPPLPDQDFEF